MKTRCLFSFSLALLLTTPAAAGTETIDQAVNAFNPLAYWRFESGAETLDSSPNGNTLEFEPGVVTGVNVRAGLGTGIRTNNGGAVTAAANAALTSDSNYHWVAWVKKLGANDPVDAAGVIGGHASDGGTTWNDPPGPGQTFPLAREGQRLQWNGNQRFIHVINGHVSDVGAEDSRDLHFDIGDFSQPSDQRFEPVASQFYMVSVSVKDTGDSANPIKVDGDIYWRDAEGLDHHVQRDHTVPAGQLPLPPTTDTFWIGRHGHDGGVFEDAAFRFAGMIDEFAIFDGMLEDADLQRIFEAGAVPEPSTLGLGLISLAGLGLGSRRRIRKE